MKTIVLGASHFPLGSFLTLGLIATRTTLPTARSSIRRAFLPERLDLFIGDNSFLPNPTPLGGKSKSAFLTRKNRPFQGTVEDF